MTAFKVLVFTEQNLTDKIDNRCAIANADTPAGGIAGKVTESPKCLRLPWSPKLPWFHPQANMNAVTKFFLTTQLPLSQHFGLLLALK